MAGAVFCPPIPMEQRTRRRCVPPLGTAHIASIGKPVTDTGQSQRRSQPRCLSNYCGLTGLRPSLIVRRDRPGEAFMSRRRKVMAQRTPLGRISHKNAIELPPPEVRRLAEAAASG
jgi:hypothetical protein